MKHRLPILLLVLCVAFASCADIFDSSSSSMVSENGNTLSQASDSVYSVVGILSKLQKVADKVVLFGEVRADLCVENDYTSEQLRELLQSDFSAGNPLTSYREYYSVINNCNYYLAHADTSVLVSNQKVLLKEHAVVKAIRAWTYLQLALTYGEVPFYTKPILKVSDAEESYPKKGLQDIVDYFIPDLEPYVDTEHPSYGPIYSISSDRFFFPVRLVLADLYLWRQDYASAARLYAEYLARHQLPTGSGTTSVSALNKSDEVRSLTYWTAFTSPNVDENITLIPMAETKLEGTKSNLSNIFSSTDENDEHFEITPSTRYEELCAAQDYAYAVDAKTLKHLTCGDLRYYVNYPSRFVSADVRNAKSTLFDEEERLVQSKYQGGNVFVYRVGTIWLRYAECVNRLGDSRTAFDVLKKGGMMTLVDDVPVFEVSENTEAVNLGIHARGCGAAFRNTMYEFPDTADAAVAEQFPQERLTEYVEDLILDEMALETAFEGHRFYDLMRVATRRSNPAYLADKVAHRDGDKAAADEALYTRLLEPANWYVPHE